MRIRAKVYVKNYELESRRKSLGMTHPDFSQKTGISIYRYMKIESLHIMPTEDEMMTISIALETPEDVLFPEGYEKTVDTFKKTKLESVVEYIPPMLEAEEEMMLLEQSNAKMTVEKLMEKANLTPKEREIIEMRFYGNQTYEEVGRHFYVTRERIRQVETKALERMRYLGDMIQSFRSGRDI